MKKVNSGAAAADEGAADAARVARVPGSINTKALRRVRWEIRSGSTYTIEELMAALGISPKSGKRWGATPRDTAADPEKAARGRRGYRALQQLRLRQFQMLRRIRGGFHEGCRAYAALVFAILLRATGHSEQRVVDLVLHMAAECHPPLPRWEAENQIRSALSRKWRLTDVKIAGWLRITDAEARQLETWRAAGDQGPRPTQRTRKIERQAFIQGVIATQGQIPSLREMSKILKAAGFSASAETVRRDFGALRIHT